VTNEIYFDLMESIDMIMDGQQQTINCCVYGEVKCNCRLTGMPDLTLTFTKPNLLDDCSLHRCVRINRYQRERVISFVPPDGVFKLLTYRIPGQTNVPVFVKPLVSLKAPTGKINITVGGRYVQDKPITNVVLIIPLPKQVKSSSLTANFGAVRVDTITQVCRWDIGRLTKDKSFVLEGTMALPPDYVNDELITIRVEFQCKMFCSSGLKVDGLAIRGVKYKPFKGVRTVTQSGKFIVRCTETF